MEVKFGLLSLVVDDSDKVYHPNCIIAAKVIFNYVTPAGDHGSSFTTIPIEFDNSTSYTPFDQLTEEQVISWLPPSLIDDFVAVVSNAKPVVNTTYEIHNPWAKSNIMSTVACTYPNPQVTSNVPLEFEETVANLVSKILVERGII